MPRLDVNTRKRVVLWLKGYSVSRIRARLLEGYTHVSLVSIYKLFKKIENTGSITDYKRKPSIPKLLNPEHLCFIDEALAEDDELTARRLNDKHKSSNVQGKLGKNQLDSTRMTAVQQVVFQIYPLGTGEKESTAWHQMCQSH